jgi:hypothetical protein
MAANEFDGWIVQDVLFRFGQFPGKQPRCLKTGLQLAKDVEGNVYVNTAGSGVDNIAKQFAGVDTATEHVMQSRSLGFINPEPVIVEESDLGSPSHYDNWRGLHKLGVV